MTPETRTRTTPTRTPSSSDALDRAVGPVEPNRFRAEPWERTPLVVPRAEGGRLDDHLSPRDVERRVPGTAQREPGLRRVKAGATITG